MSNGRVRVRDGARVLRDDGAGIQIVGDDVSGGSNDFHTAVEGLLIWPSADERGEKGVMDVDDPADVSRDELGESARMYFADQKLGSYGAIARRARPLVLLRVRSS